MDHQEIELLRQGFYSDKYFLRTQEILREDNYDHVVHYQYFPRKDNIMVCGIYAILDIFRNCTGYYETDGCWIDKFSSLHFYSLNDGDMVSDMEPCIGIIGNPKYFAHLETPTLGLLAQMSAVATSTSRAIDLLKPNQELLFFPARFRHYVNQSYDGYAAYIGGCIAMSTDANGSLCGFKGIGTVPHLLIASYGGNTPIAALKFDEYISPEINRIVLVDWDNNCIETTLQVVMAMIWKKAGVPQHKIEEIRNMDLGELKSFLSYKFETIGNVIGEGNGKLYGVRFDTSFSLKDKCFDMGFELGFSCHGVCPELVKRARDIFDNFGLHDLKIIVSGGFDFEKIARFNSVNAPVDMFGIGSSIVNGFTVDFTADAVMLDGKSNAKVGRELKDWSRMKRRN